jgi:hypothetical protein
MVERSPLLSAMNASTIAQGDPWRSTRIEPSLYQRIRDSTPEGPTILSVRNNLGANDHLPDMADVNDR